MRFDRHKEFITEEERLECVKWFDDNISNKEYFNKGLSRGEHGYKFRVTTRKSKSEVNPEIFETIFDRVVELKGLQKWERQSSKSGEARLIGVNGVICVATFKGGDTYLHTDPHTEYGLEAVTFNILIQASDRGGVLFIGDPLEQKELQESELHCYAASSHQHMVSEVGGDKARYMLICRLAIPKDKWEK